MASLACVWVSEVGWEELCRLAWHLTPDLLYKSNWDPDCFGSRNRGRFEPIDIEITFGSKGLFTLGRHATIFKIWGRSSQHNVLCFRRFPLNRDSWTAEQQLSGVLFRTEGLTSFFGTLGAPKPSFIYIKTRSSLCLWSRIPLIECLWNPELLAPTLVASDQLPCPVRTENE